MIGFLRALAAAIAIGALVDPVVQVRRSQPVAIDIISASAGSRAGSAAAIDTQLSHVWMPGGAAI